MPQLFMEEDLPLPLPLILLHLLLLPLEDHQQLDRHQQQGVDLHPQRVDLPGGGA